MCYMIRASKDTGLDILERSRTMDILLVNSATAAIISSLGTFFSVVPL